MDIELFRENFKDFIREIFIEALRAKDLNELQNLCCRAEAFFGLQEDSIRYFLDKEKKKNAQDFRPFDQEEL